MLFILWIFLGILTTVYARNKTHKRKQGLDWYIGIILFWPFYWLIYTEL